MRIATHRSPLAALISISTLAVVMTAGAPAPAAATDHHAHWHYMVGSRAAAAKNFAKQLHWEASQPGEFSLLLAHVNATDLERMAQEISAWLAANVDVNTAEENAKTKRQMDAMAAKATQLEQQAHELAGWIASGLAEPPTDETLVALRTRVADRAAGVFHGFHAVLMQHKKAEKILGIPTPQDPPAPEVASTHR